MKTSSKGHISWK